jgi:uncharacterized protein with NRDE domain
VCTVLLWSDPAGPWPLVLGAIRDEFVGRAWDGPAFHWPEPWDGFVGGRDRVAGGTWLAVDPSPERPAVAALLNGLPRDPGPERPVRPTRGELALRALAGDLLPSGAGLEAYDRFHLLVASARSQELWTWDGEALAHHDLAPGPHLIVNAGLDAETDPLVPHFAPLLAAVAPAELDAPSPGWGGWPDLLVGEGLPGDDERALIVAKEIEGRAYGSTSGALVAIAADGRVRYDFTPTPADPASWSRVV